jgi:hypothetical protein
VAFTSTVSCVVSIAGDGTFMSESMGIQTNASSPAVFTQVSLAPSGTTLTAPAGTTYLLLDTGINTSTGAILTMKGAGGDVGIPISGQFPSLIPLASSPPTLILVGGVGQLNFSWL